MTRPLRNPEQNEILGTFLNLLEGPTGDGGVKRAAGVKPNWKIDPSHEAAAARHLRYWQNGEKVDPDSGCHPLAHAAWRLLAIAVQESAQADDPDDVTLDICGGCGFVVGSGSCPVMGTDECSGPDVYGLKAR